MGEYKVVYKGGTAEIAEKKSRFIACVFEIRSQEEAAGYIEDVKKKNWDARHHCYAYVLGARGETQRFSDDGEPGGTAGRPILDVLLSEEVRDALIVVTRYFGGVLLGTGGLVRAYSRAAREGIRQSRIVTKQEGHRLCIDTEYALLGKLQHFFSEDQIPVKEMTYGERVTMHIYVQKERVGRVKSEIDNITGGQTRYIKEEDCWFAVNENQVLEWKDHE